MANRHSKSFCLAGYAKDRRPDDAWRAYKQLRCGAWVVFRRFLEQEEDDNKLHAANFCCQHHTCALCAIARVAKILRRYHPAMMEYVRRDPSLQLHMVNLTVPNTDELRDALSVLNFGWQRLRQRYRDARRRPNSTTVMRSIVAGVNAIEVKRGNGSHKWHPHMHCIWISRGQLDWGRVRKEWIECAPGARNARCKQLRGDWLRCNEPNRPWADFEKSIAVDLLEAFKYCIDFDSFANPDDVWDAAAVLRGRKLLIPFGDFRQLAGDEDEENQDLTDEQPDWSLAPYLDTVLEYEDGRYVLVEERESDEVPFAEFEQFSGEAQAARTV